MHYFSIIATAAALKRRDCYTTIIPNYHFSSDNLLDNKNKIIKDFEKESQTDLQLILFLKLSFIFIKFSREICLCR